MEKTSSNNPPKLKTKDKILGVALRLFNERGISTISSRTISEEMGISYGNLCYHYPKKEDILQALYEQMQAALNEQFENMKQEILSFNFKTQSLRGVMKVLQAYKFISLGMTQIMRENETIQKDALQQFEKRRNLLRNLVDFLIAQGYLNFERFSGHYNMLINTLLLILNSWIADAELFYQGKNEDKIDYYLEMFYTTVRRSLTPKGLEAFEEVYNWQKGV